MITNALGGGLGSGAFSLILEELKQIYDKKTLFDISILSNNDLYSNHETPLHFN